MRLLVCSNEIDRNPRRRARLCWTVLGHCIFYEHTARCRRDVARLRNGVGRSLHAVEADILNWQSCDLERWWSWRSWLQTVQDEKKGPGDAAREKHTETETVLSYLVVVYCCILTTILAILHIRFLSRTGMCNCDQTTTKVPILRKQFN